MESQTSALPGLALMVATALRGRAGLSYEDRPMKRTIGNLRAHRLTEGQRSQTCGYWFTVTSNSMAYIAFDTAEGLGRWMWERGLTIEKELAEPGGCRIHGEYREESHLTENPHEVEEMEGLHTRTLSNGQYVVAVITTDDDGIRTVHTLNPNVRGRKVFNHRESDWIMGGPKTGGEDGKQRLFAGIYPSGIVYSDRWRESCGDYVRLGFLPFSTLELDLDAGCPPELAAMIHEDADATIARRGERIQVSASGQTVQLP